MDFKNPKYEFDDIAQNIFYPIYEVIAEDLLEKTGKTSGHMLDIGCGGGHLGFAVMDRSELYGTFVDINQTAVECASKRARERGLADRSDFFTANVEQLPFEDHTFDLIVSRGSMLFWENQEKAFAEICRVLAPGGRTYIGGSLGRPEQRKAIIEQMEQNKLMCMAKHPELSKSLSNEEYQALIPKFGCQCEIVDDDEHGRWLVIRRTDSRADS